MAINDYLEEFNFRPQVGEGFVKNWVLGCMNATKWEDLSVEDNNRIIELIFTTAKLLTIKKFEQLSMEV